MMAALQSLFRPKSTLFKRLDLMAATGHYDVVQLDSMLAKLKSQDRDKSVSYYFASLYLHLDERQRAEQILGECGKPGREMKKYFAVMNYSRLQELALPALDARELRCIEYLSDKLSTDDNAIASVVESRGGFAVAGNAPGCNPIVLNGSDCIFLFNHYFKNQRLQSVPDVHVVTPSWSFDSPDIAHRLLITGNNIFHRRSSVWRQFIKHNHYQAVHTIPRRLWCSMYRELAAPASGGLLVLAYLAGCANLQNLRGTVAGFSATIPGQGDLQNHSYDKVVASSRHDWELESCLREGYLGVLREQCVQFHHLN